MSLFHKQIITQSFLWESKAALCRTLTCVASGLDQGLTDQEPWEPSQRWLLTTNHWIADISHMVSHIVPWDAYLMFTWSTPLRRRSLTDIGSTQAHFQDIACWYKHGNTSTNRRASSKDPNRSQSSEEIAANWSKSEQIAESKTRKPEESREIRTNRKKLGGLVALNRLNAILSLLQPRDRYRTSSAIGSAIGRPLSRIQT